MTNPASPNFKHHGWSALSSVTKCQIIAGATGLLLTAALLISAAQADPHKNPFVTLLLLVSVPSFPLYGIFKIFSVNLLRFATTTPQGGFSISFIILFITANTISYTVIGTLLGWIIQKLAKTKIPPVKSSTALTNHSQSSQN
jgi:D-alanyl-lipoteichoic acid acyltransferase DltB (MBOAT superfamily)